MYVCFILLMWNQGIYLVGPDKGGMQVERGSYRKALSKRSCITLLMFWNLMTAALLLEKGELQDYFGHHENVR